MSGLPLRDGVPSAEIDGVGVDLDGDEASMPAVSLVERPCERMHPTARQ
jgi:hypothetical protein